MSEFESVISTSSKYEDFYNEVVLQISYIDKDERSSPLGGDGDIDTLLNCVARKLKIIPKIVTQVFNYATMNQKLF